MKNLLLFISLSVNVLVIGVCAYFGYQGYRAARPGASVIVAGTVASVIDYHDAGYRSLHYVVDTPKGQVVVQDFGGASAVRKAGDAVKLQEMKNSFGGRNTVSFFVSP